MLRVKTRRAHLPAALFAAAPDRRPLGEDLYTDGASELSYQVLATDDRRSIRARLADVANVPTFRRLGGSNFFCDRRHLYPYCTMSDGGRMPLLDSVAPGADRTSFVALGHLYARDRRRVYPGRHGWMRGADAAGFGVLEGALARDRHRHYLWGAPTTPAEAAACAAAFSGNKRRPGAAVRGEKGT